MSAFVENAVVRCCLQPALITTADGVPESCSTCPHRDTRDLVVSQCTQCAWKACGFRYAVQIAEEVHLGTHGGLARQTGVPVSAVVQRQAFPRSVAVIEASQQAWSHFRIALFTLGSTTLVGLLALLSRWLREQLNLPRVMGIPLHALFMLCVVASLTWMLMEWWAYWRRENIRRFSVVAECNHEIRNALDQMISAPRAEGALAQQNEHTAR